MKGSLKEFFRKLRQKALMSEVEKTGDIKSQDPAPEPEPVVSIATIVDSEFMNPPVEESSPVKVSKPTTKKATPKTATVKKAPAKKSETKKAEEKKAPAKKAPAKTATKKATKKNA